MTTLALEIHDAGLTAVDESGAASPPSPGYALVDGGAVITGRAAVARAREKPRWIHHRFWHDLDTEPLGKPFPRDLTSADLAHAHLSEIWGSVPGAADSVLLAIPGCYSTHQLGLILGIARSCGLPVAGLVDAAVAATATATAAAGHPGHRLFHLDLHLHRVVLSELEMSAPPSSASVPRATVARRHVKVGDGTGQVALLDAWARRVAELFVHATRYDPLHSAAAEQALFSHLPEWLEALRSDELIEVTLGPEGRERSIELTRPDLVAAADDFYDSVLELVLSLKEAGENVTLLLARQIAELPGLEPRLEELRGVTTVRLPAGAAAGGALRTLDQIASGADATAGLPFVTRLSFEARPAASAPDAAAASAPQAARPAAGDRPTHLLHQGRAYPITRRPFRLGVALGGQRGLELEGSTAGISRSHCSIHQRGTEVIMEDHSTYGSFLNGERIDGEATLSVGDRLRLGTPGIEVELIAVVETARSHPSPPGRPSARPPSGTPPVRPPSG